MTKTNVQSTPSNPQHHDTPNNKTHVIKFRVTAEEKASLELTCKLLNLSLSTFIRRAIHNVKIEKTVIVAGGGEETLTAVSTLLAQCSNESPSGAFKRQRGLRQQMEGRCPDKRYPNKITSEMQVH